MAGEVERVKGAGVGLRRPAARWVVGTVTLMVFVAVVLRGRLPRAGFPSRNDSTPPDVVLITVDTLRRDHLSLYGYRRPTDPVLTRMAADAMVFDNAVAAHTNTGPSHASMMTGVFPPSHGVLRNRYRLKPGVVTLAQRLREQGYQTQAVVSSIMLSDRLTGLGKGFDTYLECGAGISDRQAGETWTVVDRLLSQVKSDRPMFLFVHFFDPHYPYRAPMAFTQGFLPPGKTDFAFPENAALARLRAGGAREGELEEYVARYDGEIRYADHYLGKVLAWLRNAGRYDRSLIIVTSDHGETLDERDFVFDHGARVYEEQIRVPLVIHLPGGACGGKRTSFPAHHVDLVPTVLDLLGLPIPDGVQGMSLLPELGGDGRDGEEGETGTAQCVLRRPADGPVGPTGRSGLERSLPSFARPDPRRVPHLPVPVVDRGLVVGLRRWPWKLISYPVARGRYEELFRLSDDAKEEHDVKDEYPTVTRAMTEAITSWAEAVEETSVSGPVPISGDDTKLLRSLGYVR